MLYIRKCLQGQNNAYVCLIIFSGNHSISHCRSDSAGRIDMSEQQEPASMIIGGALGGMSGSTRGGVRRAACRRTVGACEGIHDCH
jgi:hypothetical protein